ncbi:oligosaccharide flippase family protein, partial [Klebsiella pneumoniae]
MMFKKGVKFTSLSIKSIIEILREGFPYFLSRVSVSINNSIGTFFLGLKFSPSSIETGILSGITKITTAGDMLLTPVNDSIYP